MRKQSCCAAESIQHTFRYGQRVEPCLRPHISIDDCISFSRQQLRVYRAWKRYLLYQKDLRSRADQFALRRLLAQATTMLQWLHYYARRRKRE